MGTIVITRLPIRPAAPFTINCGFILVFLHFLLNFFVFEQYIILEAGFKRQYSRKFLVLGLIMSIFIV
jgi:hypothetical protein